MKDKAIVLLSGGLDSTTVLSIAAKRHDEVHALTIAYGQLHRCELQAAEIAAKRFKVASHKVFEFDFATLAASALTRPDIDVPKDRDSETIAKEGIPSTYVPARNTVFLSLATAWAETIGSRDIYIGVNVLDASGYPDCGKEYIRAFETAANLGTTASVGGKRLRFHMPLVDMTKAEIILVGMQNGVDYSETHSCYSPIESKACGRCDACTLRIKGFEEAQIEDPTLYG